jgi:glutathione peroxidase
MHRRCFVQTALALSVVGGAPVRAETTAHDFAFMGLEGGALRLADFAGRPVMVVNTASRCGFTYQYEALQTLYDRYRNSGLVVLGVPSNDFGGQELSSEAAVKDFCEVNFGIDFPMTAITRVRGADRHPFYAWAERALGAAQAPRWNFHKYLVDGEGRLAGAFGTGVEPTSARVTAAVETLLPPSGQD